MPMVSTAILQSIITPHLDRLLNNRDHPKTICPSEVARALTCSELQAADYSSWRDAMPEIRRMVAERRRKGEVEVLQRGVVLEGDLGVGLEEVVGPLRARVRRV